MWALIGSKAGASAALKGSALLSTYVLGNTAAGAFDTGHDFSAVGHDALAAGADIDADLDADGEIEAEHETRC